MRFSLLVILLLTGAGSRQRSSGPARPPRADAGAIDGGPSADAGCTPACTGKECGDDGCGGSCGMCPAAAPFCVSSSCNVTCTPDCSGKECGDDGCGGSCGSCPAAAPMCVADTCQVACTPDCTGKSCGDDGCGGSCGPCTTKQCTGGVCMGGPTGCTAAEARCTDPGAYEVCGIDAVGATTRSFGPRVPCWQGNSCAAGSCGTTCGIPEIMMVVDRSSSMQGARWAFVRDAILQFIADNQTRMTIGLRMFPGDSGCGPGSIEPIAPIAPADQDIILDRLDPPTSDSQTPIAAALGGLISPFGDPNQGQAVVLITDGDETCASDPNEAVSQAEILARSGIQVFAIGVSNGANPALLSAIAQAGRTGSHGIANDSAGMLAALDGVLTALDACTVAPGAPIGAACVSGTDCSGGVCLLTEITTWPGGYCSQLCNASPCPVGTTCVTDPFGTGLAACLDECAGITECRPDYTCATLPTTQGPTVCIPGQ